MEFLQNLPYDTLVLIDENLSYEGFKQTIYLIKTYCIGEKRDVYHLKSYITLENGKEIIQGYIYFYLSFSTRQCKFCGIFINPNFRNKGIASLLTSSWIRLCLDNNISCLDTIKRQRKPFLIYLLKTYSFEIQKTDLYTTDRKVITVCSSLKDKSKYLLFKDKGFQEEFVHTVVMAHDNYSIIESLGEDFTPLDDVIMLRRYDMQDENQAYSKALSVYRKHQR